MNFAGFDRMFLQERDFDKEFGVLLSIPAISVLRALFKSAVSRADAIQQFS